MYRARTIYRVKEEKKHHVSSVRRIAPTHKKVSFDLLAKYELLCNINMVSFFSFRLLKLLFSSEVLHSHIKIMNEISIIKTNFT